ncbi:MAG: hypothetical protein HC921_14985, partial [Synechococcaceae cyanobacterium SM2_3_1]|nr:hypothetical protein [Synechococcaceae cyanobacterium SM2_3_1]
MAGAIGRNQFFTTSNGSFVFDNHPGDQGIIPSVTTAVYNLNDSTDDGAAGGEPANIAIDPLQLVVADNVVQRNYAALPGSGPGWDSSQLNSANDGRIEVGAEECPPYVDDVYRSDGRFGPKPSYDR